MSIHREAFCLMKYATDDGQEVEWLWNSRDGVTPFVIHNRDGTKEMTHVEWNLDTPLPPSFVPPPGMRYFDDLTEEEVRDRARKRFEPYFEPGAKREHWPPHWTTIEAVVNDSVEEWTEHPAPTVRTSA